MEPHELFDDKLADLIQEAASHDIASEDATTAFKNLKTFSECRPPAPEPEPEPEFVPTTILEKAKATAAAAWDNETTRVLIKAGGAFAGVALVVFGTIKQDHVLQREAIQQANQRSI